MTPSAPVRHAVSTTASAAVLALAFGFFPTGPALAATTAPTPAPTSDTQAASDCGLFCLPILASSPDTGQNGRPRKSREPAPPASPAPPAEAPARPAQPQPPQGGTQPQPDAPAPNPAGVPATAPAVPDEPAASASPSAGYRPPTGPSSGKDWNSPVNRSGEPTQMAAIAPDGGQGPGGPALLPIIAGTVLLAVSGGAFAIWTRNRNRLRLH